MISLIVTLLILGVLVWGAQKILGSLPVAEPFKTIIYVVIVVGAVLYAIGLFTGSVPPLHIPKF